MTFEKVELETWIPKVDNESIEGIFVKEEQDVGENKSMLYHMEVNGKPKAVWGSTVLNTKMTAVRPGDLIKIEYLGKGVAKGAKNAPKMFDVYIDYAQRDQAMANAEANATPVEAAPVAPVEAPVAPAPVQAAPAPVAPATPAPAPIAPVA